MKRLLVWRVAAAAVVAGCSNDTTTSTPPVVASVTVSPASDSAQAVGVNDTMLVPRVEHLAAVLNDAGGNVLSIIQIGQAVVWTSSDTAIAKVDPYGVVTGRAAGSATITAASEGKSGTSAAKVIAVSVVTVGVKPDSVTVGSTVTIHAAPLDASGDTLVALKMIWTSSDTTIAIVNNADSVGVVAGHTASIKGIAAGTATITATISGVSGTAAVKVKP